MKEVWKNGRWSLVLDVIWLGCLAFSEATIGTEWIRLAMIPLFFFVAAVTFGTGFYSGRSSVYRERHAELVEAHNRAMEQIMQLGSASHPADDEFVRVIGPYRMH